MFVGVQNEYLFLTTINQILVQRFILLTLTSEIDMLPKDIDPQNLKTIPVVDVPNRTKEILIALAVAFGIAALIIYFWDPEFIPWMTGSTKR
jgi:hypothetical protein